jgi:hypothetical protein
MKGRIQTRLLGLLLVGIAMAIVPAPACGEKGAQKVWSVDWEPFWPRELSGEIQLCFGPALKVAASADVVALAIARACEPSSKKGTISPIQRPHWLIVCFFDASTGKLLAKREAQLADFRFELYPTAEGNFLLYLRNNSSQGTKQVDSVVLMSPTGRTLKSFDLQPTEKVPPRHPQKTFLSPSRKTLLVRQAISGTTHYQVLDADTLTLRVEWESQDPDEPTAVSVSDKEVLGLSQPKKPSETAPGQHQNPQVLMMTFDGAWRALWTPASEGPLRSFYAFLADDAIVSLHNGRSQADASFVQLVVLRTDGQVEGTKVMKKSSWSDVWGGSRIETTINGCCFATAVSSTSRFWEELDFFPAHGKLYIWKGNVLEPIVNMKINGSRLDFCFLPDGSRIVILDGGILKAYALP